MKLQPERMVLLYIYCDALYPWFLLGTNWLVLVGKVSTARQQTMCLAELHWIQQKSWLAKVRNEYLLLLIIMMYVSVVVRQRITGEIFSWGFCSFQQIWSSLAEHCHVLSDSTPHLWTSSVLPCKQKIVEFLLLCQNLFKHNDCKSVQNFNSTSKTTCTVLEVADRECAELLILHMGQLA